MATKTQTALEKYRKLCQNLLKFPLSKRFRLHAGLIANIQLLLNFHVILKVNSISFCCSFNLN